MVSCILGSILKKMILEGIKGLFIYYIMCYLDINYRITNNPIFQTFCIFFFFISIVLVLSFISEPNLFFSENNCLFIFRLWLPSVRQEGNYY
ncbi:hypothetical protein CLU79DRAFT_760318 [Phycomyces nitens]|nr:hypothetical protein CLU79DRAFT_760318 [Phycomyces nitens]